MKWVLFVAIFKIQGTGITSAEFKDEKACHSAAKIVSRKFDAYTKCVPNATEGVK